MNMLIEEIWGVVSFWIRIWALFGRLFWMFLGVVVKQTVFKNADC